MSMSGVNLRVGDIQQYTQACAAVGLDVGVLPVLLTLNDDSEAEATTSMQAAKNAGLRVVITRFYSYNRLYYSVVPQGGQVVGWNERGNDDWNDNLPDWVNSWWQDWRANRPDAVLHYGAPNVDGYWLENTALEATLDIVDRHIGSTFSPPPPFIQGRVACVTEIDIDPNRYGSMSDPGCVDELLGCAERCLAQGTDAYVWGINPYVPDASIDSDVLAGLAALNIKYAQTKPQGGNNVPYSVGPGFQAWMQANGEEAASDEFYVASDQVSYAYSQKDGDAKHMLVYVKATNQVKSIPLT